MAEALTRLIGTGPWPGLVRPQHLVILALVVLVPALLFVGTEWVWDGQYVPLFASLPAEDAGAILTQLKASKTPYRIGGGGEQILVPADRVAETRLRMAVQGLPLGGGVGFEVFDKPTLGISDFTQRLNYQRALQGELARTIGQLRGVSRARVHLVLPQPSLFAERDRPASASVFLRLAPGGQLAREEVRGIVHLVASSVEGLTADRVTVVDTAGRVLSVGGEGPANALSPRRLELLTAVEEGIARSVQSLLDTALGPGQAVARVSAKVNFDQVERTEEKFDPNGVARQKTRSVESTRGRSTSPTTAAPSSETATPGQNPPAPAPPAAAAATQNEGNRESESITYELSKVVARTLTTPGEIERLSVAVIVNTGSKVTVGPDKKEVREAVPRPPEELEKLRKVVMTAVGANESRGDQVTVVEMPFETATADRERGLLDGPVAPAPEKRVTVQRELLIAGAAVVVLAIVAFAWLLLRQGRRRRVLAEVAMTLEREPAPAETSAAALAPTMAPVSAAARGRPAAPLVPEELLQQSREREDIRQKALAMAHAEPDATAQLLRAWLVKKKTVHQARTSHDGN